VEQAGRREPLLSVRDLKVHFQTADGIVKAVDGVTFDVGAGETLAVVGESGSGKSVTSLAVMRLLAPSARYAGGEIRLGGENLLDKTARQMRAVRGNDIGMIFQEPMTSLNPVHTVGHQVAEVIALHRRCSKSDAKRQAVEMLDLVGIPEPQKRADRYPHEMSGGMRQRVMIAMALACRPRLLIADEPTTALDVTIQAQILDLMRRLQREFSMAIMFITHDLGVVAEMADRVAVMYGGRVVEEGRVGEIFAHPRMPYTAGLMASVPRLGHGDGVKSRLKAIRGSVPPPLRMPSGCSFAPRCDHAVSGCDAAVPGLEDIGESHAVRCLRWRDIDLSASAHAAAQATEVRP
jgi:peptide/nickel transport system ATP-binding protein/oligopeptide transport system ATP-binding protein